jgi:hypothetical protein
MKTNVILMIVFVALIVTRMRVMARAVASEDSWGEDENRKGGGPDWFKDYMVARDLEDQEEDGLGSEVEGIGEGEGI